MNDKQRRKTAKIQIILGLGLSMVCVGFYFLRQFFVRGLSFQQAIQSLYPFLLVAIFMLILGLIVFIYEGIRRKLRKNILIENGNETNKPGR